jgi:integrase
MRGHIRERSPGHWAIILDLHSADGRRRRKWHSFAGTKREAQKECARLIAAIEQQAYVEPARITVGEYLDRWLASIKPAVATRTYERYAGLIRNNLTPRLGGHLLRKLQSTDIRQAYADAHAGGLSGRTVKHMHAVLNQALAQGVADKLLLTNPCAPIKAKHRPRIEKRPVTTITLGEAVKLIAAARERDLHIAFQLGLLCGLRLGEIVALRWKSVDLDRGELSVVATIEASNHGTREKEPKSGRTRAVSMPATLIEELRRYRRTLAEQMLRLGIRLDADHHVMLQADGSRLNPRTLSRRIARLMIDHGSAVRTHGLRHSFATILLAAGEHPKVVSEALGHSTVGITLDTYSHVTPNIQAAAAAKLDAVMVTAQRENEKKNVR